MPLNLQTSGFPPIDQMEMSWAENLRASMDLLVPGEGIRTGLSLGIPLSSGQPTAGFTPTLTNGVIASGDKILGAYGSRLTKAASKNWTAKGAYFSLKELYYGDTRLKPTDAEVGQISTENADSGQIIAVAQSLNYGACQFGVRGQLNLSKLAKGADTTLYTWAKPAGLGLPNLRISYACVRVVKGCTTGNATGDDFVLKVGSTTLVTVAAAGLSTDGTATLGTPAASWLLDSSATGLTFKYNQTDASSNLAGGLLDFVVRFEAC